MTKQRRPITEQPGLPVCVAPLDGSICGEPAIARVTGKHDSRHLCDFHAQLAKDYYVKEPLRDKEDIEYLTVRRS